MCVQCKFKVQHSSCSLKVEVFYGSSAEKIETSGSGKHPQCWIVYGSILKCRACTIHWQHCMVQPLFELPVDVIRNIATSKGLDIGAECCGSISLILHLPHVYVMSLLETHSAPSVCFSGIAVKSCNLIPVHHVTVHALVRHGTLSSISTIAMRNSPFTKLFVWKILLLQILLYMLS